MGDEINSPKNTSEASSSRSRPNSACDVISADVQDATFDLILSSSDLAV